MDPKKKTSEEEKDKKSEAQKEEQTENQSKETKTDESENNQAVETENTSDDSQADENGEGADEKTAETAEDAQSEETSTDTEQAAESDDIEKIKAENIRLKAQLEAHAAGFRNDVIEDAVLIASNIAQRDGVEIAEALSAVAKKYPDWKVGDKGSKDKSSGFKVGADTPKQENADDNRLNDAFGIRKKK